MLQVIDQLEKLEKDIDSTPDDMMDPIVKRHTELLTLRNQLLALMPAGFDMNSVIVQHARDRTMRRAKWRKTKRQSKLPKTIDLTKQVRVLDLSGFSLFYPILFLSLCSVSIASLKSTLTRTVPPWA